MWWEYRLAASEDLTQAPFDAIPNHRPADLAGNRYSQATILQIILDEVKDEASSQDPLSFLVSLQELSPTAETLLPGQPKLFNPLYETRFSSPGIQWLDTFIHLL